MLGKLFRISFKSRNIVSKSLGFAGCFTGPILLLSYALSLIGDHSAHAYILSDKGQTKCYDYSGEISCPQAGEAFSGQDAQYLGLQGSYQDSGDGTVTALNTGLIWQQGDEQNGSRPSHGYYGRQEAIEYCAELDLGSRSEWCLLTGLELRSLVDRDRRTPLSTPTISPTAARPITGRAVPYVYYPDFARGAQFGGGRAADHDTAPWNLRPFVFTETWSDSVTELIK